MRLRDLRELVQKYNENKTYVRTFVKGDHNRVKPIKDFIKGLKEKNDDYTLTDQQTLELVLLLPEKDELEVLQNLKLTIGLSDSLIQLIQVLQKSNLMDAAVFKVIYSDPQLEFNHDLILKADFIKNMLENQSRKKCYVNMLLVTRQGCLMNVSDLVIKEFITTLVNNKLLNDTMVSSISNHDTKFGQNFFQLVQKFSVAKQLTQDNFTFLLENNRDSKAQTCLLSLMGVTTVSTDSLISLAKKGTIYIKACSAIQQSIQENLNDTVLNKLMQLEPTELALMCSDSVFLKTQASLMTMENMGDIFLIAAKKDPNFAKICILLGNRLTDKVLEELQKVEPYKLGLVSEIIWSLLSTDLLTEALLLELLKVKDRYLTKALETINNLKDANVLTADHLNKFLLTLNTKSPAVVLDAVTVQNENDHTKYTIAGKDKENVVYTKNINADANKEKEGNTQNTRQVEKGYTDSTGLTLKHSITWFSKDREKSANKLAKYKNIFYTGVTFFEHENKYGVMTEFEPGNPLKALESNMKPRPIKDRLGDFTSLLIDLNVLHDNYRALGNLTSENCLYYLVGGTLSIIDYDTARKGGSFSDDVFSLVGIINSLFKDILELEDGNEKANAATQKNLCFKQALSGLISCLSKDASSRPTTPIVLEFVNEISSKIDVLTPEIVTEITDKILKNRACEYSDIIHGRTMTM